MTSLPICITTLSLLFAYPIAIPLSADTTPIAQTKDLMPSIDQEIERLDTLIQATQQSLEGQKKLKHLIEEYKKTQDTYLQSSENNFLLLQVVKSAKQTLDSIKENHLTLVFDAEFINELTVLSQAASKRGIPKQ